MSFNEDEENIRIGELGWFEKIGALFWHESEPPVPGKFNPDYTSCSWAEDIYMEHENPYIVVLGAEYTGTYIRVLWGERLGWVRANRVHPLTALFDLKINNGT